MSLDTQALFIQAIMAQYANEATRKAVDWVNDEWFTSAVWKKVILVAKDVIGTGRPPSRPNILRAIPWEDIHKEAIEGLDLATGEGIELRLLASALRDEWRESRYRILLSNLATQSGNPKDLIDNALKKISELSAQVNEDRFKVMTVKDSAVLSVSGPLLPLDRTINVLHFGIPIIDNTIKATKRTLGVIAAVTSAGKSTLAIQMATESATHGKTSLIVSLEMDHEEVHAKAMSHRTGIGAWNYLVGTHNNIPTKDDLEIYSLIHTISCGSGTSWLPIESVIRSMHKANPIDIVFIDYFTLLEPPEHNRSANLAQRFGELSKAMRRLSQELCICVVLVCQFSRKAEEGSEPQLDYLRESGQIENDCTWALFLWNEDKNNALSRTPSIRRVKFKIPKNRNGQRGLEGVLRFDPITNSFTEA